MRMIDAASLTRTGDTISPPASAEMFHDVFQHHYFDSEDMGGQLQIEGLSFDDEYYTTTCLEGHLASSVWNESSCTGTFSSPSSLSSLSSPEENCASVTVAGLNPTQIRSPGPQYWVASPTAPAEHNESASSQSSSNAGCNQLQSLSISVSAAVEPQVPSGNASSVMDRVTRRKRQNRASQRRFRANKEAKIKDSHEKIRLLEAHLDIQRARNVTLEQELSRMRVMVQKLTAVTPRQ